MRATKYRTGGCARKSDVVKFVPAFEFTSGSRPV
jgi:hypothetical protein